MTDRTAPDDQADPGRGPLVGTTVIELGGLGPGAFAGLLLADLGAEVIRIDRPGTTDTGLLPPSMDLLNRGKSSVALDLKHPEAVEAVLRLAREADVLIESYRPGVAERLGLGPEQVRAVNPALIYARMTGWGRDGPLSDRAGHDITYLAITGALHAIGPAGGPPIVPLSLVGDFGGGATYLVMGILSALLDAHRSGRGQVVDASIVDGASHLLIAVRALMASGRWSDERGVNLFDGGCPWYTTYETADGQHMAVGPLEPRFFAEFVRLLGVEVDLRDQYDRSCWPDLRARFQEAFDRRTRAEWTSLFEGTDACVAPVLGLAEAAVHPQLAGRGTIIDVDGVVQPAPAPRFSAHPTASPGPPPLPGRDTRTVLRRAGFEGLIDSGIAVQS